MAEVPACNVPSRSPLPALAIAPETKLGTASSGLGTLEPRSEERFSRNAETDLVCRLLLEKKKQWTTDSKFPDIVDYPNHTACVSCHRPQFFKGARPPICSVCHTKTEADRKSTRLNSSHSQISYAVFCLKKKKKKKKNNKINQHTK